MYLKRLRELREDRDKTQTEIAKILGMKQSQYSRYENGVSTDYILGLKK